MHAWVGVVAVLTLTQFGWCAAEPHFKPGAKAPPFACPLLPGSGRGDILSLREELRKGQVVVLSFFHTTCKPCLKEIPRLTQVVRAFGGKPLSTYLVFIGAEDDETVAKYLQRHGFKLPVLMDRYGLRIGERYGVVKADIARVPQIVVIGKNGIVRAAWTGFAKEREGELATLLADLVDEPVRAAVAQDTLTILFTNNSNGIIGPSPVTGLGGLARRGTLIRRERAAAPAAILLDAGDFFPTSPNESLTRRVIKAYELFNYDAIGIGESEFVNGLRFLRTVVEGKTLPFVSANVKLCKKLICEDLVRPHKVLQAGKRTVAVHAFMHPEAVGFSPKERFKHQDWYIQFVDPIPSLKGFLGRFKDEVDLIVVLSHAGVEEDRKLAREIKGIDLIVGGHSQTFLAKPGREGNTVIVQAASDGQYLGKLVLTFGANGRPAVESYELIPLTKSIAEDKVVSAALTHDEP